MTWQSGAVAREWGHARHKFLKEAAKAPEIRVGLTYATNMTLT